jgi:predicted anti-sigma-YlaC factor YlaD
MTCDMFDTRLDALLEGRCTPAEWGEADVHVAACARCRRVVEAISGRADGLDAEGHEALTLAVVEKTSGRGRACASARERLCDFVDGQLAPFDRELVEGHLARCAGCSALAGAVAGQARLLPTFATLAPRVGIVRDVLDATSRKATAPGVAEKVAAWIGRAAQRPRFSLEVAYVMTVLMLVVLGNPVAAFREASVRVQPRVSAVTGAVARPFSEMRAAGAQKLSNVERALAPKPQAGAAWGERVLAGSAQWFQGRVLAPLQSLADQVGPWAWRVFESVRRAFASTPAEPARRGVR